MGAVHGRRRRHPLLWFGLLVVVVSLGLGSRSFGAHLPGVVAAYAGGTLWATAAFLGLGLLLPRGTTGRVARLAMSTSVLVEVSQSYKTPWLDPIRRTTVGGLILGYDFVSSDLACYAVGVGMGILLERGLSLAGVMHPEDSTGGGVHDQPAG